MGYLVSCVPPRLLLTPPLSASSSFPFNILTAAFESLAHGANDVAHAIGQRRLLARFAAKMMNRRLAMIFAGWLANVSEAVGRRAVLAR